MDKEKLWLWAIGTSLFLIGLFVLYIVSGASNKYELDSWIWTQILDFLF